MRDNMNPLLSIIVPVYNVEKYLDECINSILIQDEIVYELLLIDDGSTDSSPIICDRFAQKDNRVKVVDRKNGWLSRARNSGLDIAKGEYVTFVDSDDFVSRDFLKVIQKGIDCGADITIYNYIRWMSDSLQQPGRLRIPSGIYTDTDYLYKEAVNFEIPFMAVWCALYKKSIIDNNNIRFNEDVRTCEDLLFSLQYYPHVKKICVMNIPSPPIYYYRKNDSGITGKRSLQHAIDYQIVFDEISKVLSSHSFDDETIYIYQRRWTRWIIDLITNYKRQKISNEKIEELVFTQVYYDSMMKFSLPIKDVLFRIEFWLLKNKHCDGIMFYSSVINYLKTLFKHYSL